MNRNLQAILVGGLSAGALDILYAFVSWAVRGVAPTLILQSIAGGLLGRDAYVGGMGTAALGAVLHFAMTCVMASFFVLLVARTKVGRVPWTLSGPIYGAAIYLVMNRVVLPLSAFPGVPTTLTAMDLAAHIFLVGLPIALAARSLTPGKAVARDDRGSVAGTAASAGTTTEATG